MTCSCYQCTIAVNRFVMVRHPFAYKTILPKQRFFVAIAVTTTCTGMHMFASIYSSNIPTCDVTKCGHVICDVMARYLSRTFVCVLLVAHVMMVLGVYTIECWLRSTAKRHRHNFHSLTRWISCVNYFWSILNDFRFNAGKSNQTDQVKIFRWF